MKYFEHYTYAIQYYAEQNPLGSELYQKQLDYLQKKMTGYDFKLDKKKNKDLNAPKQEQKAKVVKEVE